MKALVMTAYGDNDVVELRDVPAPVVGPTDVLIDVHAASVNPLDFKIREGKLRLIRRLTFPAALGNDLAGVVHAVGPKVSRWRPGDAVFVRLDKDKMGAFAEQVATDESLCAAVPRNATMTEAASLPLAGLTSLQALREMLKLTSGQRVLIPAGAGGVGTLAIQLAKILGAHVTTTASGKGLDLVRSLGADVVVDYKNEKLEERVKNLDALFDTLGGASLMANLPLVRRGGAVCSVAGAPEPGTAARMGAGILVTAAFWMASRKVRALAAKHGVTYSYLFMRPDGKELAELAAFVDAGKLRPIVDRVYPFAEGKDALAYVEGGRAKGKVVIQIR